MFEKTPEDVFLTDFGLSKIVKQSEKKKKKKKVTSFVGNLRYSSISMHNGEKSEKKDDLEALGYMLIYFIQGSLPWGNIFDSDLAERIEKVKESKESFPNYLNQLFRKIFWEE